MILARFILAKARLSKMSVGHKPEWHVKTSVLISGEMSLELIGQASLGSAMPHRIGTPYMNLS